MTLRTLFVGVLALGLAACSDSSADTSTAGEAIDDTAVAFAEAPGLEAGTYTIDTAHSRAEFRVRHLGISTVTGRFPALTGTVTVGDGGLSTLEATAQIDAGSVDTGIADRDTHLRSGDFFDVENHPDIIFETTEIRPAADGGFVLVGDLTMRGVTNPVELEGEYIGASSMMGTPKIGFSARGEIVRQDWGLDWAGTNDLGEALVGDEVELLIEIEADGEAPAAPEA